jgi:Xaa-Pro aminopeptidase
MKKQLIKRRKRIFNVLDDNSILVLHSGFAPFKSADSSYNFNVNHNFYYLAGIDQEDVTLVIGKANGKYYEKLFIEEHDELKAKWVGAKLTKQQASELSGYDVSDILFNGSFQDYMNNHFQILRYADEVAEKLYLDLERHEVPFYNTFGLSYAKTITEKYPALIIKDIYQEIIKLRMVKDEAEVLLIKESINTTNNAILEVMKNHNKLRNEMQAEAYYDFVNRSEGKNASFTSIIAAGKNGTILHYVDNNSKIEDGSLLLMDVGCYTKHYSSDISRTFPVSGKFTKRQKEVYEVVLNCNKKCIEYAKAGVTWKEINDYAKKLLAEGCKKLGLIKEDSELIKYYYHSIGHSLGLDVHDPSLRNLDLVEGMIITIEPGLYIEEENIGIRIEDNIQIGLEKSTNLSQNIIKEVKEIEDFFENLD